MNIKFSNSTNKKDDKNEISLEAGDFEGMVKARKKNLPKMEAAIQDVLKDYSGESVCIIIQKEDENGDPDYSQVMMTGVATLGSQIAMSKGLRKASNQAIEIVMEGAKQSGDLKSMLAVASAMVDVIEKEKK